MDVDKVPAFLTPKWQWVILDLEVTSMIHEIKKISIDINKIVLTKTVTGAIML